MEWGCDGDALGRCCAVLGWVRYFLGWCCNLWGVGMLMKMLWNMLCTLEVYS